MAKAAKATKKFVSRKLKGVIKDRRAFKKKAAPIIKAKKEREARLAKRGGRKQARGEEEDLQEDDSEDDDDDDGADDDGQAVGAMSVEDFLGGGFRKGMDEHESEDDDEAEDGPEDDEDEDLDDLDDVEDEANVMKAELAKLKEKDPEFFKFLQENDQELLNFGQDEDGDADEDMDADDMDDDDESSAGAEVSKKRAGPGRGPQLVTKKLLTQWKRALIQNHSIRSLRKLLLAFRAAARSDAQDDNEVELAYSIDNSEMFNKVVMTTMRFTPVVLQHHLPYKQLANGRFKLPTNDKKFGLLQAAIKSFTSNLVHLLKTNPDSDTVLEVVTESSKMIPYIVPIRSSGQEYLKTLINLWSTARDDVRISAFLAVRKAAMAGDADYLDLALRNTYRALISSCKQTTIYNLPTINLMKNSATELFALNSSASYQHAFGYLRQLGIHLRQTLKNTRATKEARLAVCSWPYIHSLDFWSLVLAKACDVKARESKGEEGDSVMQPLIYPLVQLAMGVIRLVPSSAYIPLRLHLLRSLIRLGQRTGTYIPLFPFFTQLLGAAEFQAGSSKGKGKLKGSTLKPLELDTTLRAGEAYLRTHVYADSVSDELIHLLTEFLATHARSIAFPEMVLPFLVQAKRSLRTCTHAKLASSLKALLEKTGLNASWVLERRAKVSFAPAQTELASRFLEDVEGEAPLESAVRLARKVREQKRRLLEQQGVEPPRRR